VIPYQGRLTDAAGNPVNGAQNLIFRIFTGLTGGVAVYTDQIDGVTVTNGLFNVNVGSGTGPDLPPAIFTGGDLFLEIQAGTETMAPRQRLATVPFAFRSGISPGLAASSVAGASIASGGIGDLASVTATFPADGFVLVQGTLWFEVSHNNGTSSNFNISINDVSATQDAGSTAHGFYSSNSPTQTVDGTLFTQRSFAVAAGTRTFFLVARNISGFPNFARSRLSVAYFPDAVGTVARESDPPSREGTAPRTEAERQALSGD
jgi:hypothetical protein